MHKLLTRTRYMDEITYYKFNKRTHIYNPYLQKPLGYNILYKYFTAMLHGFPAGKIKQGKSKRLSKG